MKTYTLRNLCRELGADGKIVLEKRLALNFGGKPFDVTLDSSQSQRVG